jgi:hypothetical protein
MLTLKKLSAIATLLGVLLVASGCPKSSSGPAQTPTQTISLPTEQPQDGGGKAVKNKGPGPGKSAAVD